MTERIAAAAVRAKGRFNDHKLVWSVSPPGRHCDLMGMSDPEAEEGMEQGFVTDTGRFVDREEGHLIAKAAGQIIHRCGGDHHTLYSENLW